MKKKKKNDALRNELLIIKTQT